MDLRQIIIREGPGQYESLALALQAIAAAAGVHLEYDDVCASLGVQLAAVSTNATRLPGRWMTYGRDAFLLPAARLFGFELRDLHPPRVGVDMTAAREFAQHFRDSYEPLIRRAVEKGHPVIAWQGWPDLLVCFWGVVTAADNGRLEGTTLRGGGRLQPLVKPALQCYVVERCEPRQPAPPELAAMAFRHANGFLSRPPSPRPVTSHAAPTIVAGPEAFRAWRQWLEAVPFKGPDSDLTWKDHRQLAELIAAARLSALRFLRGIRAQLDLARRQLIDKVTASCEVQMALLARSWDPLCLRPLWGTGHGRETLLEMVDCLEAEERRLAMHVDQFVRL